ncbi:MAG: penicillin-binding protein 2 [Syntrophales bacterium]|jgi:penicillin-binding protein 2|nr:penicillin-binding protein 2 [Syntrophales bacterium]
MQKRPGRIDGHDSGAYRQKFHRIFVIVSVALSVLIFRMWYLQVIKGKEMSQRSETNSVRICKIRPLRGIITDRHGNVLVNNQPSFDVVFIPDKNRDLNRVTREMESIYQEQDLPLAEDFSRISENRSFMPVRLDKNVNARKLALIETRSLDLPGVGIDVVPTRLYLYGEMMAHLIGYVGEISAAELENHARKQYEAGDMIGKYGIERYFDAYLKGQSGAEQMEVNALGKKIKSLGKIDPVQGYSLHLTIDAVLQQTAWEAFEGKPGAAVVMDVRTGEILALVSSPSFDPNLFNGGISREAWRKISSNPLHPMEDRTISGQYPPGSTYKLVVAAAGLEEGIITPETSFHCDGTFHLGNRMFRCWQKKGHGRVNLHRAIVESCDVYFYNLGKQLGVDKIAYYARAFGFGSPTGLPLAREKGGIVPTKAWKLGRTRQSWQAGETISISIGQGFNLVTPIQLASFYAALANGGTLYRPHLVRRIESSDGQVVWKFVPERKTRVPISPQHLKILNRALWGAVHEGGGTGYALRRPQKDVCGKTGTSQVVGLPMDERARRAKILSGAHRDHALFVCFAPYNSPEIVVSVIAENAGHGGSIAAPIARKIIDAYFTGRKAPRTVPPLPRIQPYPEVSPEQGPVPEKKRTVTLRLNDKPDYNPSQRAVR